MNSALMLAFWRQRLGSPIRLAVVAAFTGFPLLVVAFTGAGLSVLGNSQGVVLAIGAGMIGQDVSSGVLTLLFARPVRRSEYVVSRWLAVGIAASVVALVQIACALGLLGLRGAMPPAADIAWFVLGRVVESFGVAAVLALLSSLIPGFADLALYLLSTMVAAVIGTIGQFKGWIWLARSGAEVGDSLRPVIDFARLIESSPMAWYPVLAYLSTVTLCLALAIVVLNRKELSYASG